MLSLSSLEELGSEKTTEALEMEAKLLILIADLNRQEYTLLQEALQGSFAFHYISSRSSAVFFNL